MVYNHPILKLKNIFRIIQYQNNSIFSKILNKLIPIIKYMEKNSQRILINFYNESIVIYFNTLCLMDPTINW